MESQERSSMLLFLSKYLIPHTETQELEKNEDYIITEKNHEYNSYIKNFEPFWGNQTNDAPTKFLLKLAERNGEPIDKIFCIVSKTVHEKTLPHLESDNNGILEQEKGKTAYDRFSTLVKKEAGQDVEIIPVYYDFDPKNSNSSASFDPKEMAAYIYNQIEDKSIGKSIYIDYTGGLRDSSLFMIAIIRYLEFKGIECKDIIYSDFFSKEIRNIRYIYEMFEMINGVSEFVGTGNARQLINLQEKLKSSATSKNVGNFANSLQCFSDAVALCNVSAIVTAITSVSEAINELEQDTSKDIFVQMFKTLIPTVREKLYIGKEPPSVLDLSQWCLDNNMLQQAVTIYNEKILKHYYENWGSFKNICDSFEDVMDIGKLSKALDNDMTEFFNKGFYKKITIEYLIQYINIQKRTRKKYAYLPENHIEEIDKEICSVMGLDVNKGLMKKIKSQYDNKTLPNSGKKNNIEIKQKMMGDFFDTLMRNQGNCKRYLSHQVGMPDNIEVEILKILQDCNSNSKYTNLIESNLGIFLKPDQYHGVLLAMKYYYAIKIIRNSINHVTGNTEKMNKSVQEYLQDKGLDDGKEFKLELTRKCVSDILQSAIDYSKQLR